MATAAEALAAAQVDSMSDPANARALFWQSIARGNASAAAEAAARVSVPPVEDISFHFDEVETEGERDGAATVEQGAYTRASPIEPDSPSVVKSSWNSTKEVFLIDLVFGEMCLARVDKGAGKLDFRACCLHARDGCKSVSHKDHGKGPPKFRLVQDDAEGMLAIQVPVASSATVQRSVFSRPTLGLSTLPAAFIRLNRQDLLLGLGLRPVVWKFLLEGYPGEGAMVGMMETASPTLPPASPPARAASLPSTLQSPGLKAIFLDPPETQSQASQVMVEEVTSAHSADKKPPPELTLQDYSPAASPQATKPSRLYGWNRPLPSATQPAPKLEEHSVASSLDASAVSDNAALLQAIRKINAFGTQLTKVRAAHDQALVDLGETIYDMRVKLHAQEEEIKSLQQTIALVGGGFAPQGTATLGPRDRQALANEVMSMINLGQFASKVDVSRGLRGCARNDQIADVVRRAELDDLVRVNVLKDYITSTQLALKDFVDHPYLAAHLPSVPADLTTRLIGLERDVLNPGGAFSLMQDAFKDMQAAAKKGGTAVTICGYTFKDVASTEAWATLLGPDIISYFVDMRLQLSLISTRLKTSEKFIQEQADARKAGYASHAVAKSIASFHVIYPETLFQSSGKQADAGRGAMTFTAACSTAANFKGDLEYSSQEHMLDMLEHNRTQYQQALTARFPPDQPKHAKTHAIAAEILLQGYWQACGFLKSLIPFYEMMTGAGLKKDDAWAKCLTYSRAVFEHVYEVRSTSADKTPGAMIHGMLRSTQMLQSYMELGWIRHPDVSSALVVAALQMEGKSVDAALVKDRAKTEQITANKDNVLKIANQIKALKEKNPNLNW